MLCPGLVFLLSPVLSPSWSGMLCPPSASLFPVFSPSLPPTLSAMLSLPPGLGCCPPSWLVSQPSLSPVSQLVSHLGLGCCVRPLGLSPKFRFLQLFGSYGGVIFSHTFLVSGAAKTAGNLSCIECQDGLKLGIAEHFFE